MAAGCATLLGCRKEWSSSSCSMSTQATITQIPMSDLSLCKPWTAYASREPKHTTPYVNTLYATCLYKERNRLTHMLAINAARSTAQRWGQLGQLLVQTFETVQA